MCIVYKPSAGLCREEVLVLFRFVSFALHIDSRHSVPHAEGASESIAEAALQKFTQFLANDKGWAQKSAENVESAAAAFVNLRHALCWQAER